MGPFRNTVQDALAANDLDILRALVREDHKALSMLIRASYDKETLGAWRAIKAIGLIAQDLVGAEHELLRETCRKLLWSLNDESGGIGWSAPEMLGEIVSADPKRLSDIIPLIACAYDIEGGLFKAGVLYGLARIAERSPELVIDYVEIMSRSLEDKDPLVRLRAIDCIHHLLEYVRSTGLGNNKTWDRIYNQLRGMISDRGEAWVYGEKDFVYLMVSEEAKKIVKLL
jgi:hypothetical protein